MQCDIFRLHPPRQAHMFRLHQRPPKAARLQSFGAIAQLGERLNGIQEVVGSIPSGSTKITPRET
jgi:hypothetical protein